MNEGPPTYNVTCDTEHICPPDSTRYEYTAHFNLTLASVVEHRDGHNDGELHQAIV